MPTSANSYLDNAISKNHIDIKKIQNTLNDKFWFLRFTTKDIEELYINDPSRYSKSFLNVFITTTLSLGIIILIFFLFFWYKTVDEIKTFLVAISFFYTPCIVGNILLRFEKFSGKTKQKILAICIYSCLIIISNYSFLYETQDISLSITYINVVAIIVASIITRILPAYLLIIFPSVIITNILFCNIIGHHLDLKIYTFSNILAYFLALVLAFFFDIFSRLNFINTITIYIQQQQVQQQNKKLDRLANIDYTTNLGNRRYMEKKLIDEWRRAERAKLPLSILMIDIDFFKKYNDHYGHLKGDKILFKVAQQIVNILGRASDSVMRYGGEEYIVILYNTNENGALEVAKKIKKGIEQLKIPHQQSNVSEYVTVSIGASCIVPKTRYFDNSVIAAADKALYQSKNNGRNKVSVFHPEVRNLDSHS